MVKNENEAGAAWHPSVFIGKKPPRVALNRAATAMDTLLLQEYCRLPLLKMTFFLGNYGQRYQEMMNPGTQDQPVKSVSRALLVRTVIDMIHDGRNFNPEFSQWNWSLMWPQAPKFRDLYAAYLDNLGANEAVSKTRFSLFLGVGKHSSIRWEREDNAPHPIIEHLSIYLYADIMERGATAVDEHIARVKAEAVGRGFAGLESLLRSGSWTSPAKDRARKAARVRKAQEQEP